jgi:hypothetical protein
MTGMPVGRASVRLLQVSTKGEQGRGGVRSTELPDRHHGALASLRAGVIR